LIEPGRYRHIKGAIYVVVGEARHSETEESLVVYHREGSSELWVRPAAMWNEVVSREGRSGPRFVALD
jgi:hypothetical protein